MGVISCRLTLTAVAAMQGCEEELPVLWRSVTHWFSFFCCCFLSLQSVIVKSVERNALNMYEARKCLLGLESSGVTVASNPSTVSCPVGLSCPGLDILSSAGLGLTGLGMQSLYLYFL